MSDFAFTLSQPHNRPGSQVIFKDGRRSFSLNFDEEFAALLVTYGARAATALAELFPEPKALLGLTEEGQFEVVPSRTTLHEHFSRLVVDYCRAVQSLTCDACDTDAKKKRNESAALLQAYCSLGFLAHRLSEAGESEARGSGRSSAYAQMLTGKDGFLAVVLIAAASRDAPYVSRAEWETYSEEMVAAMIEEAMLPDVIRLKLDSRGPLPTERVHQLRPRRRTALKACLPWMTEFLPASSFRPALHRAAVLLEADLSSADGVCSLLTRSLLWAVQTHLSSFEDGADLHEQLQFPVNEGQVRAAMVVTEAGNFRTECHRVEGKKMAVLRPLATGMPDFRVLGMPESMKAGRPSSVAGSLSRVQPAPMGN